MERARLVMALTKNGPGNRTAARLRGSFDRTLEVFG